MGDDPPEVRQSLGETVADLSRSPPCPSCVAVIGLEHAGWASERGESQERKTLAQLPPPHCFPLLPITSQGEPHLVLPQDSHPRSALQVTLGSELDAILPAHCDSGRGIVVVRNLP
ncbi:hypothetical protein VTO42DRAFT_5479 [Malbranchea cinnamomea]